MSKMSDGVRKAGRLPALLICVLSQLLLAGCQHSQLRWNTVHQSRTLTDIYEKQVLDNLAMFVHESNSLPFFAFPNSGASEVDDTGGAQSTIGWAQHGFASANLNLSGSRAMKESWQLTPVYDPRRLELMRCAYQQTLANCGIACRVDGCPNCDIIAKKFYGIKAGGLADFTNQKGITTPACFNSVAWFDCGCKSQIPKKCGCLKVGHYCGTYVWVAPGGQDELSKLTLTILDYAFNTPAPATPKDPTAPLKSVTEVITYIGKDGMPSTQAEAVKVSKTTTESNVESALGGGGDDGATIDATPLAPPNTGSLLPFNQSLRTLTPQ
jgi:hypothetical protein